MADAFVAMTSPRAHRDAMTLDQALAVLFGEAGRRYDRKVVSALMNHLDNRGGSDKWEHFREAP